MSLLKKICPEQPLKNLRWFDIGIITIIMFGQFIVNTASEGAAYSSELTGYSLSLSDYLSLDTSF